MGVLMVFLTTLHTGLPYVSCIPAQCQGNAEASNYCDGLPSDQGARIEVTWLGCYSA